MGCRRAEARALSKVTEAGSAAERREMAWVAAAESSGCMRMRDMPVLDQSVLRKEGGFEGVEGLEEVGHPGQKGNWFAMVGADEGAEGSNAGFKVGDEAGVEVEEADEGMEGLATGGYRPIADRVVLGGGRAVTIRAASNNTNIFLTDDEGDQSYH
eukprot:scaffold9242_cov113-Amphora_coffeaeformis.AAC.1